MVYESVQPGGKQIVRIGDGELAHTPGHVSDRGDGHFGGCKAGVPSLLDGIEVEDGLLIEADEPTGHNMATVGALSDHLAVSRRESAMRAAWADSGSLPAWNSAARHAAAIRSSSGAASVTARARNC